MLKIPKTLTIAGKTYKLEFNKNTRGGHFSTGEQKIQIGKGYGSELFYEVLLHEVIESVLTERDLRFSKPAVKQENGNYLFSFNHEQFEQAVKDIAYALKGFLK